MKILILAAMDKELRLLSSILDNGNEENVKGTSVLSGTVGAHEIYVAKCGIGKVNAAVNAYKIISEICPDLVINSGVAGGAGVSIGTVLVADSVAYHDVWCGPGTDYGEADGLPLYMRPSGLVCDIAKNLGKEGDVMLGLICTGDKFISKPEELSAIRIHFPDVKAVDMESAAIAQVCCMNKIDFAIVRVVSDTPGEGENISQYKNFWTDAPIKTFETLKTIILNL